MTNSKDEFVDDTHELVATTRYSMSYTRIAMETNPYSKEMLRRWGYPEYRKRIAEVYRQKWQDPDRRASGLAHLAKARAALKKKWNENPEFKSAQTAKASAALKKKWNEDPEFKSRMQAASRRGGAATKKKRDEDPEFKNRMSTAGHKAACVRWHGADCGCWQNAKAKITTDEMRRLREDGLSYRQIADRAGVSDETVRKSLRDR